MLSTLKPFQQEDTLVSLLIEALQGFLPSCFASDETTRNKIAVSGSEHDEPSQDMRAKEEGDIEVTRGAHSLLQQQQATLNCEKPIQSHEQERLNNHSAGAESGFENAMCDHGHDGDELEDSYAIFSDAALTSALAELATTLSDTLHSADVNTVDREQMRLQHNATRTGIEHLQASDHEAAFEALEPLQAGLPAGHSDLMQRLEGSEYEGFCSQRTLCNVRQ